MNRKPLLGTVSGGINDWTGGGMAVIALGISGGPATGAFGLAVGGSMMIIGYFKAR